MVNYIGLLAPLALWVIYAHEIPVIIDVLAMDSPSRIYLLEIHT
jgi:hypothetical protein